MLPDGDIGMWSRLLSSGALPFLTVAGKAPVMNFSRLVETFIIAGVTMYGTVQVQSAKLDALARATEALQNEVTAIRLERAGRVKQIDAHMVDQAQRNIDWEARMRKLEQRR